MKNKKIKPEGIAVPPTRKTCWIPADSPQKMNPTNWPFPVNRWRKMPWWAMALIILALYGFSRMEFSYKDTARQINFRVQK
jgi:hypothetical protein